jgi:hypothetical protein
MEADADTSWAGIESEQLCQWMLEQAGEKVRQEPEGEDLIRAEPADVRPTTGPSAEVKITQVRIFQPLQAEKSVGTIETDEPFRGIVRGDEPFAFEVSFELAGAGAARIAKRQIKYVARSYALNQSTGERIHLGETKPDTLAEGKLGYTSMLPEATLHRGMYCLWVLVALEAAFAVPDYLEVPLRSPSRHAIPRSISNILAEPG